MGLQCKSVDDGWVLCEKTGSQAEETLIVAIEKVGVTYEGGGRLRCASLFNVKEGGRRWGDVWVTMSKATTER